MEMKALQTELQRLGYYLGKLDGDDGPKTQKAVYDILKANNVEVGRWINDLNRQRIAAEQQIYKLAGIEVGKVDGLIGPATLFAREDFAKRKKTGAALVLPKVATTIKIVAAAKPKTGIVLQKDCPTFFGAPGTGHTSLTTPFPMRIAWDTDSVVNRFTIHEKCHDSALLALNKIQSAYSMEDIRKHGFDLFGGCFNNRKMRGGNALSMHAYACAIDFDPTRNQLKWTAKGTKAAGYKDAAYFARPECKEWVDIWYSVGWISLGRERDFDWMHVQYPHLK